MWRPKPPMGTTPSNTMEFDEDGKVATGPVVKLDTSAGLPSELCWLSISRMTTGSQQPGGPGRILSRVLFPRRHAGAPLRRHRHAVGQPDMEAPMSVEGSPRVETWISSLMLTP